MDIKKQYMINTHSHNSALELILAGYTTDNINYEYLETPSIFSPDDRGKLSKACTFQRNSLSWIIDNEMTGKAMDNLLI